MEVIIEFYQTMTSKLVRVSVVHIMRLISDYQNKHGIITTIYIFFVLNAIE